MDVNVSTVAREVARSRTDAHADGSTFVFRKATISGFAANPTGTPFANALKAYRNHRITFKAADLGSCVQFHLMPDEFHLMPEPTGVW